MRVSGYVLEMDHYRLSYLYYYKAAKGKLCSYQFSKMFILDWDAAR